MDLLKNLQNLHLDGDKKQSVDSSKHAPAPPPAATTSAHKPESLFDQIGGAIGSRLGEHKAPAVPVAAAPSVAAPHKEDLLSKLGGALAGKQTPPPPSVAATPAPHKEDLFSKLGDALTGRQTPPQSVAVPATHRDENILSKLTDALSGKQDPPPRPPAPAKHDLVHKLTEVVTGKPATPPPSAKHGLVQQLTEVVTGHKQEQPRPHGLVDKLNNALGGGAKGEAEEGKLDKAIDLFQEHILKEGPQNHESALEQAKDKHIADVIRGVIGGKHDK